MMNDFSELENDEPGFRLLSSDETMDDVIINMTNHSNKGGNDRPLVLTNLDEISNKFKIWTEHLPNVTPYYAVKANDDIPVLKILADIGTSFDCASKDEIQTILQLGVEADRIIFANTIKPEGMIKYAAEVNVSLMTFDNEDELIKIHRLFPTARLLLRIKPITDTEMTSKFGCVEAEIENLLSLAKTLEMNIVGISFQVGIDCKSEEVYVKTLGRSRDAFSIGERLGFTMDTLNVGGGFPGEKDSQLFLQIAKKIREFIKIHFSSGKIKVIAEPGKFFVKSAVTMCVKIIGRRVVKRSLECLHGELDTNKDIKSIMYYLNDGLHGRFAMLKWESPDFITFETLQDDTESKILHETSLVGPTCSVRDVLQTGLRLPEHQIGEWLYVSNFGAYWMALGMNFNRMPMPKKYFFTSDEKLFSTLKKDKN